MTASKRDAQATLDAAIVELQAVRDEIGQLQDPAPAAPTFDELIAPLAPPLVGSPAPNKQAKTLSEFKSALLGLASGDWLVVTGTFDIPGEIVFAKAFTKPTRVEFQGPRFTGAPAGATEVPAIYMKGCDYLQLVGHDTVIHNAGGHGWWCAAGQHWAFDGFLADGCGANGGAMFPAVGDLSGFFVRFKHGEIGMNNAYDPHVEKGTGLHGLNCADQQLHAVYGGTIIIDGLGSTRGGSTIELGQPKGYPATVPHHLNIYVRSTDMKQVATSQVAGNAVNLWGDPAIHDITFKVIEASNNAGRAVSQALPGPVVNVKVEQGTAVDCCQNPNLAGKSPWQTGNGVLYGNVTPAAA